jgi:iron complex transport system ATP-binding protein
MYLGRDICLQRGGRLILSNVDLEISSGQITTMIGPNGAGKSSLLKILAGELRADSGELLLNEREISKWSPSELATVRAVVPQSPSLGFDFLVYEVVHLGLAKSGAEDLVSQAISDVGLQAQTQQKYTSLSGGEKQRTHLARALVQIRSCPTSSPRFLLLDEPTASLDLIHTEGLMHGLASLCKTGVGVFMIVHDVNLASVWSDHLVLLTDGAVVSDGVPDVVITSENLEKCFSVEANIIAHPQSGRPVVLPSAPRQGNDV